MEGYKLDKETINKLPLCRFKGRISIVEEEEDVNQIVEKLSKEKVIGFDTETKPSFKKGVRNSIALVQLSTMKEAYLIRVHHTGYPESLIQLFNNPNVIKVGVGIRDDLRGLNRVIKFKPKAFVEMQDVAKKLGINTISLKALSAIFLEKRVSKRQRLSNWEATELSRGQIEYAAIDAWVGVKIYNKLLYLYPEFEPFYFTLKK